MGLCVSPRELLFLCPALTTKVLAAEEVTQQWSRAWVISASPSLKGQGDSSGGCAQSWFCGQWQLQPSSWRLRRGGPAALPALPSHSPGSRRPPAPAGTSQLSWEALGSAGTEQAEGRGAMGENVWDVASCLQICSTQCHAKSHWAPRSQGLILLIKFLWSFSKPLFWDSHCHRLPYDPQGCLGSHWDKAWANIPLTKLSTNQRQSWAGLALSVPTQWAALLFCSSALSFPHIFSINTCQPLRFCEITALSRLGGALRPVPGKCCRNVKHPYGWPYHWERNLKSDLFVWLPESHCCIIHDSLLFFRRLILLPSPLLRPHTAFIIWILYSELNHTVLCSGQ